MKTRFRLYREIADCCLLSLRSSPASTRHILVDCGAFLYGKSPGRREVVDDIVRSTGGTIDLAVITHEACDRVRASSPLQNTIVIKKLLLPWLLDPADPDALRRRLFHEQLERKIRFERLRHALSRGLLKLDDHRSPVHWENPATLSSNVAYYRPNDASVEVEGIRIHFQQREPLRIPVTGNLAASTRVSFDAEDFGPFDEVRRIPFAAAQQMPFFREHYWQSDDWRRLDTEASDFWAGIAESVQIETGGQLPVLAIEFSGRLFTFLPDAAALNGVDGLLAKTILCKVSHHSTGAFPESPLLLDSMPALKLMVLPPSSSPAQNGFETAPVIYANQKVPRRLEGVVASTKVCLSTEIS